MADDKHKCKCCRGESTPPKQLCRCCGKPVPEARAKFGYTTCIKCAEAGVKPIREVTIAATSLQWF